MKPIPPLTRGECFKSRISRLRLGGRNDSLDGRQDEFQRMGKAESRLRSLMVPVIAGLTRKLLNRGDWKVATGYKPE